MSQAVQNKVYYRPKECANYLGVSIGTIWNYIKDRRLETKKISSRVTVISIDSLEQFVNNEV